ncbi:MAG: tRNA (adenosine(37)-N6)-threonylcarbamoyltransferase complex ATPase subunit type 1 TsaE [Syntrophobacteraceae bacterium]
MKEIVFESPGEECSFLLGRAIGALLEPGDILALRGELGAGKTLLVRGIARGLGVPASLRITSPTFTIINEYSGRLHLYHLDLYRLSGPDDLDTLPWQESLFGNGVAAIEWPERLGRLLPTERMEIELSITGNESRNIRIGGRGRRNRERLAKWVDEFEKVGLEPPCLGGGGSSGDALIE